MRKIFKKIKKIIGYCCTPWHVYVGKAMEKGKEKDE